MLAAHGKLADVDGSTLPPILPVSIRFSIVIISFIIVSVGKSVSALAVFKGHQPVSIILITVLPGVDAITVNFVVEPLTYVGVVLGTEPGPKARPRALLPLALVRLSVTKCVDSLAMWLVVFK